MTGATTATRSPADYAGKFITLEGIDGSGKSTQAKRLAAHLQNSGQDVVLTREPGGSCGAEEIRALLVDGAPNRWSAITEVLLFTAARRDHLERLITPALARGQTVICDRFADSTRVYQGVAREDRRDLVDDLHRLTIGLEPDLTLILDVDPANALNRGLARKSGEDRFEEFGLSFQQALRVGFQQLSTDMPRCRLIDATGDTDTVAARILAALGLCA